MTPEFIRQALSEVEYTSAKPTAKIVWLGKPPIIEYYTKSKKGNQWEMAALTFQGKKESMTIQVDRQQGMWLSEILPQLSVNNRKQLSWQEVKESYEAAGLQDFELFWDNKPVNTLYKMGLLKL